MSEHTELKSWRNSIFATQLRELLEKSKCSEVSELFAEAVSQGVVDKDLWEIVPLLVSYLTKENHTSNDSLYQTCEDILLEITKRCNPKETLLLLLSQSKNLEDEVTFRCLLKGLHQCLTRCSLNKCIDWCVQTIKHYINNLPQPENEKPQGEGSELVEKTDPVVERLIGDCKSILEFLKSVTMIWMQEEPQEPKTRNYMFSLHLFLFGYPFCYIKTQRLKESIFEASLMKMACLTGDLLKFHSIIDNRSLKHKQKFVEDCMEDDEEDNCEGNVDLEVFISEKNIPDLAYANYYYYLLNSDEGRKSIPQIYSPEYLMRGCFYLATCMLKQPEYVLVTKGLKIVEAVLERVEKFAIGHEVLETSVHHDLFDSLAQVMIYCDVNDDRKMALKVFRAYIDLFNMRARYLLLLSLYETSNHSGMLALLTGITKTSIIHCLDQNPRCEYFLGGRLERLMRRICRLPNGSASDLVEISDEITAALNLLRFLIIRDRDNSTGIWKMVDYLEKEYLKPLREGIDMSRAHWKVKIKDLQKRKKNIDSSARTTGRKEKEIMEQEVTVMVGGQQLPTMPASEKIKFCRQAINALDIIESIVIRVNECIEENSQISR